MPGILVTIYFLLVIQHQFGGGILASGVTLDARALQQGLDVPIVLHIHCSDGLFLHFQFLLTWLEQGCQLGQVGRAIVISSGKSQGEIQALLSVGVTTTAVVAFFAWSQLVPCLRYVQDHGVTVQRLESEGNVGGDSGQETGVWIAFRIEDLFTLGIFFAQRNLADDAQALLGMVHEIAGVSSHLCPVTEVGTRLHGQDAYGEDIIIGILARIRTLGSPIRASPVLRGIERVEPVEGFRTVARACVALVKRGGADQSEGGASGQSHMLGAIVSERRKGDWFIDPVDRPVAHHRFRLHFIIARIVLELNQFAIIPYRSAAGHPVDAPVVIGLVHGAAQIVGRAGRPHQQQVIVWGGARMGYLADVVAEFILWGGIVLPMGEPSESVQALW